MRGWRSECGTAVAEAAFSLSMPGAGAPAGICGRSRPTETCPRSCSIPTCSAPPDHEGADPGGADIAYSCAHALDMTQLDRENHTLEGALTRNLDRQGIFNRYRRRGGFARRRSMGHGLYRGTGAALQAGMRALLRSTRNERHQAIDLVTRKLPMDDGVHLDAFIMSFGQCPASPSSTGRDRRDCRPADAALGDLAAASDGLPGPSRRAPARGWQAHTLSAPDCAGCRRNHAGEGRGGIARRGAASPARYHREPAGRNGDMRRQVENGAASLSGRGSPDGLRPIRDRAARRPAALAIAGELQTVMQVRLVVPELNWRGVRNLTSIRVVGLRQWRSGRCIRPPPFRGETAFERAGLFRRPGADPASAGPRSIVLVGFVRLTISTSPRSRTCRRRLFQYDSAALRLASTRAPSRFRNS